LINRSAQEAGVFALKLANEVPDTSTLEASDTVGSDADFLAKLK
jgi:hypothetical protein